MALAGFSFAFLPVKAVATPEQARSADAFVDSIGVNVHPDYGSSLYGVVAGTGHKLWEEKLLELGIRHIRTHVLTAAGATKTAQDDSLHYLAGQNVKFNLLCDPRYSGDLNWDTNSNVSPALEISTIAGDTVIRDATLTIEGANEYDIRTGPVPANWNQTTLNWQNSLYDAVATSLPATIAVTGGAIVKYVAPNHYLDVAPHALPGFSSGYEFCTIRDAQDFGVAHPYPGGNGLPDSKAILMAGIGQGTLSDRITGPNLPLIFTETGYHNALHNPDGHFAVSETASGKYLPRLLLDFFSLNAWNPTQFSQGAARTFLYELLDENQNDAPNDNDKEDHFGLVRNTASSRSGAVVAADNKPAFFGIKNLIAILGEPSANFVTGKLDYVLDDGSGGALPSDVRHLLLQKSDGTFYLVLWRNLYTYDAKTWTCGEGRDVTNSNQAVRIQFSTPAALSASASKLYNLTQATYSSTTATITGGYLTVPSGVPDEPVIIKLSPAHAGSASPDVVITNISWSSANPGDAITFSATLKNQGGVATPANTIVSATFSVDGSTTVKTWGTPTLVSGLAPGATLVVTATGGTSGVHTWTAPGSPGLHSVEAVVDDVNRFSESDESNNTTTAALPIGPDLIITALTSTPSNPAPGSSVQFKASVKNIGSQAVSGSVSINFAGVSGSGTNSLNTTKTSVLSLSPGSSTIVTSNAVTAAADLYLVTATADSGSAWAEADETNNTFKTGLEVGSDLNALTIGWSSNGADPLKPQAGDHLIFNSKLRNEGVATTDGATVHSVTFKVNSTAVSWEANDTAALLPWDSIVETANGGPGAINYWTVPGDLHTATTPYAVAAVVDDMNRITESDETNNNDLSIVLAPDLTISGVTCSPALPINSGTPVTFTATVVNNGRIDKNSGPGFNVQFYIDDVLQSTSTTITSALAVGGTVNATSVAWTPTAGAHKFKAIVDNANAIKETNESNNTFVRGSDPTKPNDGLLVH